MQIIIQSLYVFGINLITYGGGGVYIPVYENYYVDIFHIMNQEQYYNLVSILNVIPGATGGKLAGYAFYHEYGILAMFLAIILFAGSGIMLVLILEKGLSKVRDNPIFTRVNTNIKPVVVGILLTITYNFYEIALNKMNLIVIIILTIITSYLLGYKKVKMYNLVIIYLTLSVIINSVI